MNKMKMKIQEIEYNDLLKRYKKRLDNNVYILYRQIVRMYKIKKIFGL